MLSKRANTLAAFQIQHDTLAMWGPGGEGLCIYVVCVFIKLHINFKIRPFRARFAVYMWVCCADHSMLVDIVLIFPNRGLIIDDVAKTSDKTLHRR